MLFITIISYYSLLPEKSKKSAELFTGFSEGFIGFPFLRSIPVTRNDNPSVTALTRRDTSLYTREALTAHRLPWEAHAKRYRRLSFPIAAGVLHLII